MISPARSSLSPQAQGAQAPAGPAPAAPGAFTPPAFAAPAPANPAQPAMPQPASLQPESGNISSAQLDQAEVDDIAAELKRSLNNGSPAAPDAASNAVSNAAPANPPVEAYAGPLEVKPAPAPEVPKPREGTLHLNPKRPMNSGPAPDDTIFIDKEGTLRPNGSDAADGSAPASAPGQPQPIASQPQITAPKQ
jgi:hypothetical protein